MRTTLRVRGTCIASALLVAIAAAGCGGGAHTAFSDAHLVVAYPAGLTDVGLNGAVHGVIVAATSDSVPASPAVSPDGRAIAYLEVPAQAASDNGADLWLADRDGQHPRLLLRHAQPDHSIRAPAWEDNQHLLVVVDQPGACDGCNPATTSEQTLDRVDVRTGAATIIRRDVTAFDVSPDRRSVVLPDTTNESAAALVVADFPDGDPRVVVPLERRFAEITSPRFSPDGSRIAFAAADGRVASANERLVSRAPGAMESLNLDGLPENVWAVDASGGNLRLVASLREDQPALAWSPDGAALFVIGTSALYRVDVVTREVARLGVGAVHSQLAYVPASGS